VGASIAIKNLAKNMEVVNMLRILRALPAILLASSMSVCATSALASGDAAAGAKLFGKSCAMCHTTTKGGASLMGPNLFGVAGHKAGGVAGFAYSPAMKGSSLTWDQTTLAKFFMTPATVVPGSKMVFAPLKSQEDADSVAAYLATLK
jgi:cytochrome c